MIKFRKIYILNRNFREENTFTVNTFDEFKVKTRWIYLFHWDGTAETEEKIKQETKLTIRCIPQDIPMKRNLYLFSNRFRKSLVIKILMMSENNQILQILQSKSSTKQEVFRTTLNAFRKLTKILEKKASELSNVMSERDKFVDIGFIKKGDFESHIKFSGDRLIFHMHSNVFDFPDNHSVQKTSYIKDDNLRSFCGVIHIYNFLNDSFKYNRLNDVGFLLLEFL